MCGVQNALLHVSSKDAQLPRKQMSTKHALYTSTINFKSIVLHLRLKIRWPSLTNKTHLTF